jgi:SAM-dependent methyltransferase
MKIKPLIYGIVTFMPGANRYLAKGTGGTDSARYCYSVWLRHLVMAKSNELNPYPKIVAELGPGDSLGIGFATLLSGCEKYLAFDVVKHANTERNVKIFDELVSLFSKREPIPGEDEFPKVKPYLNNYEFPSDILDEKRLKNTLDQSRVEKIRNDVIHQSNDFIQYKVPWDSASVVEKQSVDMIYSQAVLEHVDDLKSVYKAMRLWLKPKGYISHQIDFKCHGTADEWNGHWAYSDFMWKLIRGRRPYLLNREPLSKHIAIMREEGFDVVCLKKVKAKSNLTKNDLSQRFKFISEEDITTSGAFIQAVLKS